MPDEVVPPKIPTWGFEPATAAPEARVPYTACVSWPRSGHHLLKNLLQLALGERFGYCEYYVPSSRPGIPCCKQFPCVRRDVISLSKNHDFDLRSPVPRDIRIIVQHRSFLPTLVSNFELHVKNDHPDTAESFRSFATRTLKSYKAFRAKWVTSDLPNRLALDYETLTADTAAALREVIGFMQAGAVTDAAIDAAIAAVPGREGDRNATGVRVTRDVATFRFNDPAFLAELDRVARDDSLPALPLIDPPAGPRRDTRPDRPLYVYVHMPRAAGTSMRVALTQLFGRYNVFWHGRDGDLEEIVRTGDLAALKPFDVVGGTIAADLLPAVVAGRPTVLVSVVRNPIGRVLSLWESAAAQPDPTLRENLAFGAALAPGTGFSDAVRAAQSRWLTGAAGPDALARLRQRPHLVATHERAQLLVDRLAELAGISRSVAVPWVNSQRTGYQTALRTAEALAMLRRLVADDMVLFKAIADAGGLIEHLPPRS